MTILTLNPGGCIAFYNGLKNEDLMTRWYYFNLSRMWFLTSSIILFLAHLVMSVSKYQICLLDQRRSNTINEINAITACMTIIHLSCTAVNPVGWEMSKASQMLVVRRTTSRIANTELTTATGAPVVQGQISAHIVQGQAIVPSEEYRRGFAAGIMQTRQQVHEALQRRGDIEAIDLLRRALVDETHDTNPQTDVQIV